METPKKIVTYPIADDPIGGAVFLFGALDAPNMAICSAGYPDDHECFLSFASNLAKKANCLVGVTCLPGYDDREDHPYTANKNEGYTFEEMTNAMREAIKALRKESTYKGTAKLTGIFHDWGLFPGQSWTNRSLREENKELCPDQLVIFDVLGPPHPEMENVPVTRRDTLYETVMQLTYRIVLATSFGIRRFVSKTLAQIYFLPNLMLLGMLRMSPTSEIDAKVIQQRKVPITLDRMIYMAYPYFNMFKSLLIGQKDFEDICLPRNLEKTPMLYMYGLEKRINFHDRRSVEILKREEKEGRKSKVVAVENAGHWLYLQQPELCLQEVTKFISDA
mmetsp:Transcript_28040/g.52611  ORF Transcript_28040/g.52611 Transcript_28040/m.52611 type:complete len:334 (+) Transcript_28040:221-1222(+)|eukprot:CAMPEP_0178751854 /NCGR_PEP_ID=MMETSP0744-20121128/10745_1 /TAXON_ID=913974 /ORGANISM="Nitzschia punctata, Strain CCMP561" /LENGTH=333 /DNA_ID=CAMNT_0020405521 /DNA_START=226 /DNA_END=1227 /DNA_ORIENTATION=-